MLEFPSMFCNEQNGVENVIYVLLRHPVRQWKSTVPRTKDLERESTKKQIDRRGNHIISKVKNLILTSEILTFHKICLLQYLVFVE